MGGFTTGHCPLTVAVAVAVILCLTTSVTSQSGDYNLNSLSEVGSLSFSLFDISWSQSASLPLFDRIPCIFRGGIKEHGSKFNIDPCTECTCKNGTTDCDIITCSQQKCSNPVTIPEECCPLCPYTMEFFALFNGFQPGTIVTEGKANRFKLDAEIEIFKGRTSRRIRGENMWKLSAWVSRSSDGSGPQFSLKENILSQRQRAQAFSKAKADYSPPDKRWTFKKLKYTFNAKDEGLCEDFKFFCIKFNYSEKAEPKFDLDFTFSVFKGKYFRQTECVRLGPCKGVFPETFDWSLTGENPIPGEETPVSIDVDVTFRDDTRDLDGDGLWRVALFGSSNPDGDGPRFGEVAQILNDDEASTDIQNGDPIDLDGIHTEFDIGTVGCIDDVNYLCMEFLKGDAPNPDFTLIVEGGHGDISRDSMIVCKPQECQAKVVFTELEATLLSPDIIVENTDDTDTTVRLIATTDKVLTSTVAGEQLWTVKTFFSKDSNGIGRRINEQQQILTTDQHDQTLNLGENLNFQEMDFQVDLSGIICNEIPYMCFELAKNPAWSIDYTFETQAVQDAFVDCLSMEDVCKGSQSASLPLFDRIPCVFRGDMKEHGSKFTLDPCTECVCKNGTTYCDIITCATPKCSDPVTIPEACCPLCPYTMEFFALFNGFQPGTIVTEGKANRFKLDAEIEIFKGRTSRRIRGENMWKLSAWVSRNSDGSGPQFSLKENILSQRQRAQEFSKAKADYSPPDKRWTFKKLKYTFNAKDEGLCEDFKFFCIKFNYSEKAEPKFDLDFTFSVFKGKYFRQTECVRLGPCKGVFPETFDWTLTGENPIPGEETPVSIDVDVTFRDDTRDLDGDGLWRVALFGSSNPDGDGPRFGEVAQILNDDEASTDIQNGDPIDLDGIQTEFDIGTVRCIDNVNYVCMEFSKGDAPNPDFTLIVEGGRGDISRDSMIVCKPQECQAKVVFTELEATLLSPDITVENTDDTDTTVRLTATTDKVLTSTVAGEQLWTVKTFFSEDSNGIGRRINEQQQILTADQVDQTLNLGENLNFQEMDFQVDLSGIICNEIPYMCFELAKNPASSIDYTFETQPVQDAFVDCLSMENVC